MDYDTREWSDGILTNISREVIKDSSKNNWIIFDSDIDPEWIEALNSVLDDNKLVSTVILILSIQAYCVYCFSLQCHPEKEYSLAKM